MRRGLFYLLILAVAFPMRFRQGFAIFHSISVLELLILALIPIALVQGLVQRRTFLLGPRAVFAVMLLPAAATVLSLMWTQDLPATIKQLVVYTEALLAYLAVINAAAGLRSHEVFRWIAMLVPLLLVGSVLSLAGIPGFEPPVDGLVEGTPDYMAFLASYYTRLSHPFLGLSNNLATVLAFFLFVFLAYGIERRRLWAGLVTLLAVSGIVLTMSRGIMLALVIGLVAYLLRVRTHALKLVLPLTLMVLLLGGVASYFVQSDPLVAQALMDRQRLDNVDDRFTKLSVAADKIVASPLVGYGGGVAPDKDYDLSGGVHNAFIQQVLYFGLPMGSLVALALWGLAGGFLFNRDPDPAIRRVAIALGAGLLAQMIGFISESSFEGTLLKVIFYFCVGAGVALLQSMQRETRGPAAPVMVGG